MSNRGRRAAALAAALLLALPAAPRGAAAEPKAKAKAEAGALEVHRLQSRRIDESSGLVASRAHPGVFWTHNDSGDTARIFAIDREGKLLGEFAVNGARNVDWEDLTIDDAGHLFLADIGNNDSTRRDLVVYRVREPDPRTARGPLQVERALRFRYADQTIGKSPRNYDAEALVWYAGSLYIFTKDRADTQTRIYRLQDREGDATQVLQPLGSLELGPQPLSLLARATGASLSPDGRRLALLTYGAILLYERSGKEFLPLEPLRRITLDPLEAQQAESITWDGAALLFGNEQARLFRIADPLAAGSAVAR